VYTSTSEPADTIPAIVCQFDAPVIALPVARDPPLNATYRCHETIELKKLRIPGVLPGRDDVAGVRIDEHGRRVAASDGHSRQLGAIGPQRDRRRRRLRQSPRSAQSCICR
jgi:hypothetical protein